MAGMPPGSFFSLLWLTFRYCSLASPTRLGRAPRQLLLRERRSRLVSAHRASPGSSDRLRGRAGVAGV